MNYIDFGLGILRKNHFDLYGTNQTFDLSNVYQGLVKENELLGFESKNRFYEIGSAGGIKDLSKYLNKN
jgi:N-acetyl-alpha-D-muramate 1-phosphate uridylyltransferase